MSTYYYIKSKLVFQENYAKLQFKHYQELEENNNLYKNRLHDIKSHLITIDKLIDEQQFVRAEKYSNSVKEGLSQIQYSYTFINKVLQIIVNEKSRICKTKNIKLSINLKDLEINFICDYDLNTIIGNIFDNAIEACKNVKKDKKIEFRLYQYGGYLVIYMYNTSSSKAKIDKSGAFISTKGKNSGIGINNTIEAIKKYNGIFKYETVTEYFIVKIIIPTS